MEAGSQKRAPVYEALEQLKKRRVVPFDVPGHKRGRGNPELVELLGEKCVSLDVNSMKPLDNLCHPVSVIKEAEELAAEAFRADHAFFMVGGQKAWHFTRYGDLGGGAGDSGESGRGGGSCEQSDLLRNLFRFALHREAGT